LDLGPVMPLDPSTELDPLVSRPRRTPPGLMMAGLALACALGGGLGLWARPSGEDVGSRAHADRQAPPRPEPPRQIEIRVDHPPRPAKPFAAQPAPQATGSATANAAPPDLDSPSDLIAPRPAPQGLVRVHAVEPERLSRARDAQVLQALDDSRRRAKALAAAHEAEAKAARAAEEARKAQKARAAREAKEARAEAQAAAARKARREQARLAEAAQFKSRVKSRAAHERRVAEREAAEQPAERKAAAAREAKLADARQAARALTERRRLAEQVRRAPKPAATKASATTTAQAKTARSGLKCASPDPGAALTCSDPSLTAAERQLVRAYRQAEAAGVPSDKLERQQKRWLAARANAALKAPWAVHDIYLARIAELQDQTRQASRGE